MTTTIYHNPRCSKSRQSLELLESNDIKAQVVEYLKTPPDAETLKSIIAKLGIDPRALLRKHEDEFKLAGLDNIELSDDDIIAAMIKYPKLIERPIVIHNGEVRIGRPPEIILELFK